MGIQQIFAYGYPFLIVLLSFIKIRKTRIDWVFRGLLLIGIISEYLGIISSIYTDQNLFVYMWYGAIEFTIISYVIYNDTKNPMLFITIGAVIWIETIAQTLGYSFLSLLTNSNDIPQMRERMTARYFEISSITTFFITLLCFYWVWFLVNSGKYEGNSLIKRFIYSFSILFYFGCSFFVVALPRMLMPELQFWNDLWARIFTPIYVIYYLGLLIAILWKDSSPSSSQPPSSPF